MANANRNELTIEISGLKEINEALKGLPIELASKVLDQATRKQMTVWRDVAAQQVPVGHEVSVKSTQKRGVDKKGNLFSRQQFIHTPGTLRRSIKVKKIKSAAEGGSITGQESRFGLKVLGKAFYWKFIEFGSVHNQPPKPIFRNTFAALAELSLRRIADDCAKAIERYFRKQNKGKTK